MLALAGAATPSRARSLAAYRGTGSWVSIYDTVAWRNPARVVRTLQRHRVHTLFLETANDRQHRDVVRPVKVAQFIVAAHRAGLRIVGWYLPSLATPGRDLRRAVAGARFRTPDGQRFDSFALDIESTTVRPLRRRSIRATSLAAATRRAMPRRMTLGAITIDPVGGRYWDGYPFKALAESVQVFLPMEYFTARTKGVRRVARYSSANVVAVRARAGDSSFPVHPVGGDARHASVAELRAFLRGSATASAVGVSLWEYGGTSKRQWAALARRPH